MLTTPEQRAALLKLDQATPGDARQWLIAAWKLSPEVATGSSYEGPLRETAKLLRDYNLSLAIELVEPLKKACDRAWENETPEQVVAIAANAIYWRDARTVSLEAQVERLTALLREARVDIVAHEHSGSLPSRIEKELEGK